MVTCTPHPGSGTVAVRQGAHVRTIDLTTCKTIAVREGGTQRVVPGSGDRWTIRIHGRVVFRTVRQSSVEVVGGSPDAKWILFAVDPMNSASIAADGLSLQAVSVHGGKPRTIGPSLLGAGYHAWCGRNLVVTAGGDRIAAHRKWLIVTRPPDWKIRRIVVRGWSFGALACRAGGVVVQATRSSTSAMNPRWQLWQVGLDGSHRVLDVPPPGYADDSPRVSHGAVGFVRSRSSRGVFRILGVGAALAVGIDTGFYGRRPWANVSWSKG